MIEILTELCIKCGYCIAACPSNIFKMEDSTVRLEFEEYCILCGHCIAICPEDAVRHDKLEFSRFRNIQPALKFNPGDLSLLFQTRRSIRNFSSSFNISFGSNERSLKLKFILHSTGILRFS